MNSKIIIFYAPTGLKTEVFKIGGAEAGCLKTIEIIKKSGNEIIIVEKPKKEKNFILGKLKLFVQLMNVGIHLLKLFNKYPSAKFHLVGFYLDQIYFEYLFIKLAKLFSIQSIYEIRNGGMIFEYNSRSAVYKYFMKNTLKNANGILCQGLEYVTFIKVNKLNSNVIYYPNYVLDSFLPIQNEIENKYLGKVIELVYLGRVVEDKNIEFIIEILYQLKLLNLEAKLSIIGGYSEEYFARLMRTIKNYNLSLQKDVSFLGRLSPDEIKYKLIDKHFFVFPSKEKREGHSNALTETMAYGIVPIASNVGFNESIIGYKELVLEKYDSVEYAIRIKKLVHDNTWKKYSIGVYNRIKNNYTESIVKNNLLEIYK